MKYFLLLAYLPCFISFLNINKVVLFSNKMALNLASEDFKLGGKIVVSGIGESDEDEFFLNLLNEQKIWSSVVLASSSSILSKKRFLSRTARYSGLLNILEFADFESGDISGLRQLLQSANAWIAFNASKEYVEPFADLALDVGVKRMIVTVGLHDDQIEDTMLEAFESVSKKFQNAGLSFTGIRHGQIVSGGEDNPYEIVNSTTPLPSNTVERGVLGRVTAELLLLNKAANQECGVSSSTEFAAAYLNILRSTGLTRSQEVDKMFSGGLQRVAKLTSEQNKVDELKLAEEVERKRKLKEEREAQQAREEAEARLLSRVSLKRQLGQLDEEEMEAEPSEEGYIEKRSEEILKYVWSELDARLVMRSTSKLDFIDKNKDQAIQLAKKEVEDRKSQKIDKIMQLRSQQEFFEKYVDASRRQYAKLLNLERKELQNQKQISDTWIKYIYLLLQRTTRQCMDDGVSFERLDAVSQTLLLRQEANKLRALCSLPAYDAVYDPLDASAIVAAVFTQLARTDGEVDGGEDALRTAESVLLKLNEKYGHLLESVPALQGAQRVLDISKRTLAQDLPAPGPSADDLGLQSAKEKMVERLRLNAIQSRGVPILPQ